MVAVPSTLPVASVTATLTPVRKPGSRPIVVRAPAGAASSRSRRLAANTRTASSSAACHSRTRMSTLRCIRMRVRQAQCTVACSHWSAGRPWSRMPNRSAMRCLVLRVVGAGLQGEVEDLLLLAAEQGQDAVRGQPRERLAELEVVGELRALLLLALADPGGQRAAGGHRLAQLAEQVRVLGEPLDQDGAGAVQGGGRVGDALVRVDEVRGRALRVAGGVAEQQVGQRLQAGLAGDLRLGAPLRLVGQVEVFQPGLGVGRADLGFELVGQLALGGDLLDGSRPGARRVRAGSAAAPRACAAARRRARRWPPCGTWR